MLKLKPQCFGHLMGRADSFEKTLMLGKIEGRRKGDNRGWDVWMASPTRWTWVWVDYRSSWWTGRPGVLWFMGSQRVGHDWVTELNWILFSTVVRQTYVPINSVKGLLLFYHIFTGTYCLLSSYPQSFPASGTYPMSQLFASGGQSIGVSASESVLPMNTQD